MLVNAPIGFPQCAIEVAEFSMIAIERPNVCSVIVEWLALISRYFDIELVALENDSTMRVR